MEICAQVTFAMSFLVVSGHLWHLVHGLIEAVCSIASIKERKRKRENDSMHIQGWSRAAFLNYCLRRVLVFCRRCREHEKMAKYLEGNGGIDVSSACCPSSIIRSSEKYSLSREISFLSDLRGTMCVARFHLNYDDIP